ncbi:hypothetical protein FGB62_313g05 [Gracilaria domingensis]|nr:hypothetical protein FGB62_313g05 [Gracilaria domingensis]
MYENPIPHNSIECFVMITEGTKGRFRFRLAKGFVPIQDGPYKKYEMLFCLREHAKSLWCTCSHPEVLRGGESNAGGETVHGPRDMDHMYTMRIRQEERHMVIPFP